MKWDIVHLPQGACEDVQAAEGVANSEACLHVEQRVLPPFRLKSEPLQVGKLPRAGKLLQAKLYASYPDFIFSNDSEFPVERTVVFFENTQ